MTTTTTGLIPQWTLTDRLRKARELTGLDRADFAREIGVSRNTVTNYEHGKVEQRLVVLRAWAMRSGVSFEWLQTGCDPSDRCQDGHAALPTIPKVTQPKVSQTGDPCLARAA